MTVYRVTNTDTSATEAGTLAYALARATDGDTLDFTLTGNFIIPNGVYLPNGNINFFSDQNLSGVIEISGGALNNSTAGSSSIKIQANNYFRFDSSVGAVGDLNIGSPGLYIYGSEQTKGTINANGFFGIYGTASITQATTLNSNFGIVTDSTTTINSTTLNIATHSIATLQGSVNGTTFNNAGSTQNTGSLRFTSLQNTGTLQESGRLNVTTIQNTGSITLIGTVSGFNGVLQQLAGTIDLDGQQITPQTLTVTGGTIQNGSIAAQNYDLEGGTISASISSSYQLVKSTANTLFLSGTNNLANGIALNQGALIIAAGGAGSGVITFASGANATLEVDSSALDTTSKAAFANTIAGFDSSDTIDVARIGTSAAPSFNYAADVLTLTGNGSTVATLQLSGDYHGKTFKAVSDGANGVDITLQSYAPTVSITGVSGATNLVDHVVSGTVDAADAGSVVTVMNGNTALGTATSDANGNWSLPFVYTGDGSSYSYNLTATDTNATGTGTSSATSLALNFVPNETSFGTISHDTNHPGGKVYALYEGLLGRAPDAQGAEGWVASLYSGTTVAQVAQAFLNSPEGQQSFPSSGSNKSFVDTLYQKVLGRSADAGGEQDWVNNLNAGESRADVADAFVFSNEHVSQLQSALNAGIYVADTKTSMVARLYYGLLGRAPDAGGLSGNTQAVNGGASVQTVAQSFISSNEYQSQYANLTNDQFVTALYQNALGRSPDQRGLQSWDNQLAAGTSRASVAVSIIQSQEGQNHLAGKIETGFHFA